MKKRRFIVQLVVFILFSLIILLLNLGFRREAHSFCPYSIVCFGINVIRGLEEISFYIVGMLIGIAFLLISLVYGRVFCGWVCPLGSIQEFIYKISHKKNNIKKRNIPQSIHLVLTKLKYLVLIANIVLVIYSLEYLYMQFCPVLSLGKIGKMIPIFYYTIGVFLILSIFIERFFCRYLCPYAALMNLVQYLGHIFKFPLYKVRIDKKRCINCHLCSMNCPMQIDVCKDRQVTDVECIQCGKCLEACNQKEVIKRSKR